MLGWSCPVCFPVWPIARVHWLNLHTLQNLLLKVATSGRSLSVALTISKD